MCLAMPAKIVELDGEEAVVDVSGSRRKCNVAFLPDVAMGDYVLMHAGFAIRQWSEQDVKEYNEIMGDARHLDVGGGS